MYSCLENPVDGGAQQAAVDGAAESCTRQCMCVGVLFPVDALFVMLSRALNGFYNRVFRTTLDRIA